MCPALRLYHVLLALPHCRRFGAVGYSGGGRMEQDLWFARQLQEQYDREMAVEERSAGSAQPPLSSSSAVLSVVDPVWELLDPNPDVRALFAQFNDHFFWGRLGGVEVKWSSRMTLCAGVCSYEGRDGLCSIRLSEPLLKLRPRKDLVEIYHNFHDEVDEYRKHWWRCNGPCQNRKPYLGYVKRAMNRPPSAIDTWWADHQHTCGGTFLKIKEPENYSKKGKEKSKTVEVDIQTKVPFSGKGHKVGESSEFSLSERIMDPAKPPSAETTESKCKSLIPLPSKTSVPASYVTNTDGNTFPLKNRKLPKPSVANTKIFKNINGSPLKIFPGFNNKWRSNSNYGRSKENMLSSDVQTKASFMPKEKVSSVLGEPSNMKDTKHQSKRQRMNEMSPFANFFVKTSDVVALTSFSSRQSMKVCCPVCGMEILETDINEHLDSCLAIS
ncbi:sprT-like domain-containing protein Spartan isoform X2 [Rhinatrema bivittatum]|uniref:sprT-like domain-containing protein Spartan isoform X2 n=1 Tax=Rhinatrema bivittatum TaxID=194408 RepID=UPI0011283602|nr:sprT-like domain-containing protein Spartan isoform X2 [Rhinatrema bivittatum]